tara:strand:+ start:338 stop:1174 length:837 start_codon:yes stop_codon:yes gene_type:complete
MASDMFLQFDIVVPKNSIDRTHTYTTFYRKLPAYRKQGKHTRRGFPLRKSYIACLLALATLSSGCDEVKLKRERIPVPANFQEAMKLPPTRMSSSGTPKASTTLKKMASPCVPALAPFKKSLTAQQSVAGLSWRYPKDWKSPRRSSFRAATYKIPGGNGAGAGECAVFYFGPRQGGDVSRNLIRWKKQFTPESQKTTQMGTFSVNNLQVASVTVEGTFLSSVRPMSPTKVKKADYSMWGLVFQGPKGKVFFKCVGPKASMKKMSPVIESMICSVKKAS